MKSKGFLKVSELKVRQARQQFYRGQLHEDPAIAQDMLRRREAVNKRLHTCRNKMRTEKNATNETVLIEYADCLQVQADLNAQADGITGDDPADPHVKPQGLSSLKM